MKIALLCGGPSLERGISLNSARSVLDHLEDDDISIHPIYFDQQKKPYVISTDQLYSNTPSDFDFKLHQTSKPLDKKELIDYLRSMDIVFPVMHGTFGEDGEIQNFLEKNNIPYIGANSASCKKTFDKFIANQLLGELGFFTLPSALLKIYRHDHKEIIENFFKEHNISRAVVKPASGGSSIGVFSVTSPEEALEKVKLLFSKRMDTRVVIEEFATGTEFTTILLQNRFGLPVAILPTEIETDYTENQIFDFRRKYLPTRQVIYHCPPRLDDEVIETIQLQAEQLFSAFGMRDFARFDGWVLPDGNIWFADFNPISGMEQNSFLFQQASRIGLTHRGLLRYIVRRACQRYSIKFPEIKNDENKGRKPVSVLFGGKTSERQVSLMSGTNVWLKLRKSRQYDPKPFILDSNYNVWQLPYALTLNHTVEEIIESCEHAKIDEERLKKFQSKVAMKLALSAQDEIEPYFQPIRMNLEEFANQSKFVFIALHGGIGEDGTIQKILTLKKVPCNGSGSETSLLCIDKHQTSQTIMNLKMKGLSTIPNKLIPLQNLPQNEKKLNQFWTSLNKELSSKTLVVKPKEDGCSSGVVHLYTPLELQRYLDILKFKLPYIPPNTFRGQTDNVELPVDSPAELLFEKYIDNDILRAKKNKLIHRNKNGYVEITIGVFGKDGILNALNPSITVAEGEVLTVEEKFQGGTGVNITPPPAEIMSEKVVKKIKKLTENLSAKIKLKGYARIDAFANTKTGDLIIIEINTLPGLTPSTVIFHQALAEKPKLFPREFLETIIKEAKY